ncbi:MAG: hypothetical protein MJ131_02490 [Lachnospiraceae bacterium]|nr:hypothetical protein [Lachnospiraceae bacterium]
MGKVILCSGKKAEEPFIIHDIAAKAETIEELCYCLRQNLDMLDIGSIDRDMAVFIRESLGLPDRGKLLEQLILQRASIKDRVVAVFCSCDFYDEQEIREACLEMDEIAKMSNAERRKRRADRYMQNENYYEAAAEYRSILASVASNELSEEAYGDILHNLGVFEIRRGEVEEAIRLFLDAYERNSREISLRSYLYALKLTKNVSRYRSEVQRLVNNVALFNEIEHDVSLAEEDFEQSSESAEIIRLKVLWQQGRFSEAKRLSSEIIARLKHIYRDEE